MITNKSVSQVDIFAGSPWEVNCLKELLCAAYIDASIKDKGTNNVLLSVPYEQYTAAMKIIDDKKTF
ncbi:DUF2007-related protein [uncultured Bacteroides sp.]|uniref:DUF2007-related protein n=1 Tax=uncultured Bacteroides sp. TaxID=162156 RepID=UPI002AAACD47|nr:DUF2007-related protein [uncultured Bacteroides sp.]